MTDGENGDDSTGDDEPDLADLPLSLEALLGILANKPRRYLLEFLQEQPEGAGSFEEVTKYILTEIGRDSGEQPNHDDVQIALQHHHLPKLADSGVIEYDIRSQTIRYRPNERLEDLHDRIRDFQQDHELP